MSRRQNTADSTSSSQRTSSRLANSSSNDTTEVRNGRKRPAEEVVVVEEEENTSPNNNGDGNDNDGTIPTAMVAKKYDVENFVFPRNEKELMKFEALPREAQAQCIKAVCRLFVMKGLL